MCLAIMKPRGVCVAKKYLANGFANNKEGAGFVICKDGKLEISKGFFKFNDFWKAFKDLQRYPALIHFRIATHGEINEVNCHPFMMLGGQFAMVHNGVLPIDPPKGREESDTEYFANGLAPLLDKHPFRDKFLTQLIEEAIGACNKIVVMRNDGEVWIFNEICGWWHKGAWFSNTSYSYVYGSSQNQQDYWWKLYGHESDSSETNIQDGEYSFTPETDQEREVQRWLDDQERKSKTESPKSVVHIGKETYGEKMVREAAERKKAERSAAAVVNARKLVSLPGASRINNGKYSPYLTHPDVQQLCDA
jgi:predicted glutamine amidotransferase